MIAYVLENIRKYIEANLKRTEMNVDGWNILKTSIKKMYI